MRCELEHTCCNCSSQPSRLSSDFQLGPREHEWLRERFGAEFELVQVVHPRFVPPSQWASVYAPPNRGITDRVHVWLRHLKSDGHVV